jgi:hypothetical protein
LTALVLETDPSIDRKFNELPFTRDPLIVGDWLYKPFVHADTVSVVTHVSKNAPGWFAVCPQISFYRVEVSAVNRVARRTDGTVDIYPVSVVILRIVFIDLASYVVAGLRVAETRELILSPTRARRVPHAATRLAFVVRGLLVAIIALGSVRKRIPGQAVSWENATACLVTLINRFADDPVAGIVAVSGGRVAQSGGTAINGSRTTLTVQRIAHIDCAQIAVVANNRSIHASGQRVAGVQCAEIAVVAIHRWMIQRTNLGAGLTCIDGARVSVIAQEFAVLAAGTQKISVSKVSLHSVFVDSDRMEVRGIPWRNMTDRDLRPGIRSRRREHGDKRQNARDG